MEPQRCYVIFKDPNVGEFQHEVQASVDWPLPYNDLIRFPASVSSIVGSAAQSQ